MKKIKIIISTAILVFIAAVILMPFYMMIIMTTYETEQLYTGLKLLPGSYTIENIRTVFSIGRFPQYYLNSAVIAISSTVLSLITSAMAGFAFSKYTFPWKKGLFFFVLIVMMIPGQLGMIAFMIQIKWLGLSNSHLALILPSMANFFGVFWMTQYMNASLPMEVIESARIDGASDFRVFAQIAVPFATTALITLGLFAFLGSWNSYMMPMLILNSASKFTVPLGIAGLNQTYRQDQAAQMMALSIGTLPIIIMFAFGSKHFIRGLVSGAIKG